MSSSTKQSAQLNPIQFFDQQKFGLQQFIVIALCLLVNMLDGFDITAMAVVASDVSIEMNIPDHQLGLVFSFSLAGMMLGAMFLASLSDVFGRRKVILYALLIVGVSVVATAYVNSIALLIVLRFISGLGAGAMLASQATLASEYSSERFRALAVAVVTAGYPLGAMFTGVVGGYLVPEFGWRSMFLAGGVVTLILWLIACLLLPESLQFLLNKKPNNALQKINAILKRFSAEPISSLPANDEQVSKGVIANILSLLDPAYRVKTITLWVSFMFAVFTLYYFLSWLPKSLINEGFDAEFGRQAFTLFNLGGVVGIFLLGALAARWKLSRVVSLFFLCAALLMFSFSLFSTEKVGILILVTGIGLLMQGGFVGLYALPAKLYASDIRSTGVGWAIGLGRLGAVFGPAVAGYLIASGISIEMNFAIFAIPVVLACLGVLKLRIS